MGLWHRHAFANPALQITRAPEIELKSCTVEVQADYFLMTIKDSPLLKGCSDE